MGNKTSFLLSNHSYYKRYIQCYTIISAGGIKKILHDFRRTDEGSIVVGGAPVFPKRLSLLANALYT